MNATAGSSPTKRRAALASLDANAMAATTTSSTTTPTSSKHTDADSTTRIMKKPSSTTPTPSRSSMLLSSAPVLAPPVPTASPSPSVGTKRRSGMVPVLQDRDYYYNSSPRQESTYEEGQEESEGEAEEGSPVLKRSKLDNDNMLQEGRVGGEAAPVSTQSSTAATTNAARSRTNSPDASSVFDVDGGDDNTWATESDVAMMIQQQQQQPVVTPVTRPRALTREQAREKVEILRLRLGLASYKLRTGQTSIPLDDLQARPLPTTTTATAAASSSSPAATVENTPSNSQESLNERQDLGNSQEDNGDEDVVAATPPPTTQ